MLILIFLLIVGAGFTFLSTQNSVVVSLTFLNYHFSDQPINYVIMSSVLVGAILTALIKTRYETFFGKIVEVFSVSEKDPTIHYAVVSRCVSDWCNRHHF